MPTGVVPGLMSGIPDRHSGHSSASQLGIFSVASAKSGTLKLNL